MLFCKKKEQKRITEKTYGNLVMLVT